MTTQDPTPRFQSCERTHAPGTTHYHAMRPVTADRPPEPPTLDVERLARAMHEAGTCENWSPGFGRLDANGDFHDDHGAAEHFHEARRVAAALGASPPPPDLSELRAALDLADYKLGILLGNTDSDDPALQAVRRARAALGRATLATTGEPHDG